MKKLSYILVLIISQNVFAQFECKDDKRLHHYYTDSVARICKAFQISKKCKPDPNVMDGNFGLTYVERWGKKTVGNFSHNQIQCYSDYYLGKTSEKKNQVNCTKFFTEIQRQYKKCPTCLEVCGPSHE